jgi:hypothetical protein
MDDKIDEALNRIERRIIANRDPMPCDDFQPCSKMVATLCAYCGHFEDQHRAKRD